MRKLIFLLTLLVMAATPFRVEAQPLDPSLNRYLQKNRGRATGPIRLRNYATGAEPTMVGGGWIAFDSTANQMVVFDGSSWTAVGGGGAAGFDAITSGTNTTAAMVVGTGASINVAGTGTIVSTTLSSIGANTIDLGADSVALTIEAAAGQTANLITFNDSTATEIAKIEPDGAAHFPHVHAGDHDMESITIDGTSQEPSVFATNTSASDLVGIGGVRHSTPAANSVVFTMAKSQGSHASPSAVDPSDSIGQLNAAGYDGDDYTSSSRITFEVDAGTVADTRMPGMMRFFTGTDAAPTVLTEAMRIDSSQTLTLNGALRLSHTAHAFTSTFQQSATASASVAYILPTAVAAGAGYVLTDAAGDGVLSWAAGFAVTNETDNRLITSLGVGAGGNAEANATFDGSTLSVTGTVAATTLTQGGNPVPDMDGTPANYDIGVWIDSNTIGKITNFKFDAAANPAVINASTSGKSIELDLVASSTAAAQAVIRFHRSRGTVGSETDVAAGDLISQLIFAGYDEGAYRNSASIGVEVDPDMTNRAPGIMKFYTTPDGSSTPLVRMAIDMDGIVYLGEGKTDASPTSPFLQGTGGLGTDDDAGDFTIRPGASTGAGDPGRLIFQGTAVEASGTTAQTYVGYMSIDGSVGGDNAKVQIETQLVFKELTAAPGQANGGGYGQLWTESDNEVHFLDGDGNESMLSKHDGASAYFNANGTAQQIETVNSDHLILNMTSSHTDGGWTFDAGSTSGVANDITAWNNNGGDAQADMTTAHGLSTGDVVSIRGTTNYNGVAVITVDDVDTFTLNGVAYVADDATGDWDQGSAMTAGTGDAGDYSLHYDISVTKVSGGSPLCIYTAYVNASAQNQTRISRTISGTTTGAMGSHGVITIADGDIVTLAVQCSVADNQTISYGNMMLQRH